MSQFSTERYKKSFKTLSSKARFAQIRAGYLPKIATTDPTRGNMELSLHRTGVWGRFREERKMDLYAIRRRSAWANPDELEKAAGISARIGNEEMPDQVRWIRSYVVAEPDGRLGTICIYEARDVDSIREHARRVGMPGDEVESIAKTVVVRPDPGEAAQA